MNIPLRFSHPTIAARVIVTPFGRFDYFDPAIGILWALLSVHNLRTMLVEMVLIAPLVTLCWYVGKAVSGVSCER